jgi:hypothetical protein
MSQIYVIEPVQVNDDQDAATGDFERHNREREARVPPVGRSPRD